MLRVSGIGLICALLVGVAVPAAQTTGQKPKPPAPAAGPTSADVTITASYTGKGVVDATNEILVFLFDHPNPTAESRPLGMQAVTKNGGSVTFKGLTASPVYAAAVYDEKGVYAGQGPPPVGTPYVIHGVTAKTQATPIVPGPKGKATVRFDGSNRWK
jgi:hypothetical protein